MTLTRSEIRTALRLLREQHGLKPKRKTLAEARSEGFNAGVRAALREIEKLTATEKEKSTDD